MRGAADGHPCRTAGTKLKPLRFAKRLAGNLYAYAGRAGGPGSLDSPPAPIAGATCLGEDQMAVDTRHRAHGA